MVWWSKQWIMDFIKSMQVLVGCISPADMVVRGWWGDWVPVPTGVVQHLLPIATGARPQEVWPPSLQLRARPRLGQKTRAVPALDFGWPASDEAVLLEGAREVDQLPRRWLRRGQFVPINEGQVFDDTDRLHAHEGWTVCRFCSYISCRVQREVTAFLIATDLFFVGSKSL